MIIRPFCINARVSEEESREIREQAEASQLTVSEYVRQRIFGKRVVPQANLVVLGELRRLGGLLKYAHLETRGTYSERTADAIRALEAYVRTLELSHKEREGPTPTGSSNFA
jgi:hypothetical protein